MRTESRLRVQMLVFRYLPMVKTDIECRFNGRYNTMVVMMYRPSPQVPKPSTNAALKCYDAVQYNVFMHREQVKRRNVEATWIFVQSIFMAVNTLLWTLSYEEVRKLHPREEVQSYLDVGLESILLSAERWPGTASAHHLYVTLIEAVLKVYDRDGDINVSADSTIVSPESARSQSTPTAPLAGHRESGSPPVAPASPSVTPFGYIQQDDYRHPKQSVSPVGLVPFAPPGLASINNDTPMTAPPVSAPIATTSAPISTYPGKAVHSSSPSDGLHLPAFNLSPDPGSPVSSHKQGSSRTASLSPNTYENIHYFHPDPVPHSIPYDPKSPYNKLPTTFAELGSWSPTFILPNISPHIQAPTSFSSTPELDAALASSLGNQQPPTDNLDYGTPQPSFAQVQQYQDYYPDPYWTPDMLTQSVGGAAAMYGNGLAATEQAGLMQNLENIGPEQIERMIAESNAFFNSRTPR